MGSYWLLVRRDAKFRVSTWLGGCWLLVIGERDARTTDIMGDILGHWSLMTGYCYSSEAIQTETEPARQRNSAQP